jgi:hypothetical protein
MKENNCRYAYGICTCISKSIADDIYIGPPIYIIKIKWEEDFGD